MKRRHALAGIAAAGLAACSSPAPTAARGRHSSSVTAAEGSTTAGGFTPGPPVVSTTTTEQPATTTTVVFVAPHTTTPTTLATVLPEYQPRHQSDSEWWAAQPGQRCGGSLPSCAVMERESGGSTTVYNSEGSGASGKWQVMPGTWRGYGGYANAADAPESVQDDFARQLWDSGHGCAHWSAC